MVSINLRYNNDNQLPVQRYQYAAEEGWWTMNQFVLQYLEENGKYWSNYPEDM